MTNYSNDEGRIEDNEFTNLNKAQKIRHSTFVTRQILPSPLLLS